MRTFKSLLIMQAILALPLGAFFFFVFAVAVWFGVYHALLIVGLTSAAVIGVNAGVGLRCRFVRKWHYHCTSLCCWGSDADLCHLREVSTLSKAHGQMDKYVHQFREARLNLRDSIWVRAAFALTLLAVVLCPLLTLLWIESPTILGVTLSKLTKRLEVGSVLGSFILMTIAFAFQPEQKKFIISKVLFGLVQLAYVGLFLALAMVIRPMQFVQDPQGYHIWALLAFGAIATLYDILGSFWVRARDERRELLEMCFILDVPMLLSSLLLSFFWQYQSRRASAGEAEGLLAGALVMQFVLSAYLFALVKSRLIRTRAKSDLPSSPPDIQAPPISRTAAAGQNQP